MLTITDRMAAWRRERRVLQRESRTAWHLEQAERERARALASARAEAVSIRTLAAAAGLVSARVHQITAGAPCGRDRGDRVGASMVVLQTGADLLLRESVQAVVLHSDVIITAAGADIAVHKPTLPRPVR